MLTPALEESAAAAPAGAVRTASMAGTGGGTAPFAAAPGARGVGADPGAGEVVAGIAEIGLKLAQTEADRLLDGGLRRAEPGRHIAPADRDPHRHLAETGRMEPHHRLAPRARQQSDHLPGELPSDIGRIGHGRGRRPGRGRGRGRRRRSDRRPRVAAAPPSASVRVSRSPWPAPNRSRGSEPAEPAFSRGGIGHRCNQRHRHGGRRRRDRGMRLRKFG